MHELFRSAATGVRDHLRCIAGKVFAKKLQHTVRMLQGGILGNRPRWLGSRCAARLSVTTGATHQAIAVLAMPALFRLGMRQSLGLIALRSLVGPTALGRIVGALFRIITTEKARQIFGVLEIFVND